MRHILDDMSNQEIALKQNTYESSAKPAIQELFCKAGIWSVPANLQLVAFAQTG
jgi:hypothetical protein